MHPTALATRLPSPSLPALSPAERAEIAAASHAAITRLAGDGLWSPHTVRAYAGALRYWDAWHHAAFGFGIPLLADPRQPVSPATVKEFIAHHAPVVHGERVDIGMPATVRDRLTALSVVGRRQASQHSAADPLVPSLATVRHRVASLNSIHTSLGLPAPSAEDPYIARLLRAAANVASIQAPAVLRRPKAPVKRDLLMTMLNACAQDGLRGLRDAALLHLAFHTGGRRRSELAALRWDHLTPLPRPMPSSPRGYTWSIMSAKGRRRSRADRGVAETAILDIAADALDAWRSALQAAGALDETGRVWIRLQLRRDGRWLFRGAMDEEDIAAVVKRRAAECGMDPRRFAGHSLRSGAATTALDDGEALGEVSAMLDHRSLQTTRTHYDHRSAPIAALSRLIKPRP